MKFGNLAKASAVAVVAALALTGCAGGGAAPAPSGDGQRGGTLTIGALADVTSWDPAQAHVGHALQPYQAPYDTLILREPDGTLSPMLATEWSYNDDRTQLTIDLRTDVTFSDGEVFNADAVQANFDHFKAANGRQAAQLAAYESTEVVDEDTVVVTLATPDPAFEYYLSQAAGLMGSPAALDTEGISTAPVGSGPYEMDTQGSVTGSQYTFTAREDYWNPELQKFDKIVFKVLTDPTARLNALVSGQVDATLLEARAIAQAEGAGKTLTAYQTDWAGLLLMDRDGAQVPALADVRVRQAINHALDRDALLETLALDQGTTTGQVFGPDSGAFVEEIDDLYPYDPDKARELLEDAGFGDGFEFSVPTVPGFETILAVVGQQLADVGITMTPQSIPPQNLVSDLGAAKFPATFFFLFQGEPWVAINQMISTSALYNPFDSTTPELQELIDAVQYGGDESAELAKEVNRYVTENAWFAPVYRPDQIFFTDGKKITVEPQIQQAVPSIYNFSPIQ